MYNKPIVNLYYTMDTLRLFKQIGFTKKKSEILEYLYKKGESIASRIAKELHLPKSTVLFVLYKLEEKELVEKQKVGKTFHFQATDPSNLLKLLDDKIKKEKEKKENLLPLIPSLRQLKDLKPDNKVFYYDKESSISDLLHSINERLDNKDIEEIYKKESIKIYYNEDFTFVISKNLAIRFKDIEICKKFISMLKNIDEEKIKA